MKYLHKDFHGALSCGFTYLTKKYGREGFEEYCRQVARNCYFALAKRLEDVGLKALEEHWRHIFTLEGGDFLLRYKGGDEEVLILEVRRCPAINHMKERGYKVAENFCEHTKLINDEICRMAGYSSSCDYDQGEGKCIQRFWK